MSSYSLGRRAAAWGVHGYTALGLPLGVLACRAIASQDLAVFFTSMWLATFIDATDGFLARRVGVKQVLPHFDGRRLDDIVDYLMFVFLPAIGLVAFGALPGAWGWAVLLPVLSSAYGFCQEQAKTEDAFVGFPSYWNIIVIYLLVLGAGPVTVTLVLVALAVLVFVPIHYLYPSRTRFLRAWTIGLGIPWSLVLLALCLRPDASWAVAVAWGSLAYPLYYLLASLAHHRRVKQA